MDRREKLIKGIVPVLLIAAFLGPVLLAQFLGKRSDELTARRDASKQSVPAKDAVVDPARKFDLVAGEQAYMRNCGMCHGYEAVGKVGVAPSFSNPDFLALATDKFIRTTVREGRLGTAMAPRREIPRQELANIIAYLRSLPEHPVVPVALDLEKKSQGDPENGRRNFASYCSPCHGPNGAGYVELGTAPGIALPGFLHLVSDDYIFQTVKNGRSGTPMRGFLGSRGLANLTAQDIDDIIVFLRAQDPAMAPQYSERMGEEAFNRNCAACHQAGGRGLVGVAPSLSSPEFLALVSDEFIRTTAREGRAGTTMVPRHGITDSELDAIVEYLRSLPTNGIVDLAVDHDARYTGDTSQGERNFTTYCAPCHGPHGEGYALGGSGPAIGLPSFLAAASDDCIYKTVKYGRTGTPMRPFIDPEGLARLEDQDVFDIIAFQRNRVVLP